MTSNDASPKKATGASAAPSFSMSAFTTAGTAQWIELMKESGRFIAQRLEEDLKTQKAFFECKTPADVMQVQTNYYKTAVEQYSAEAGRIFEFMSGSISGPLASSRSMFARGYDDVPL